MKYIFAIRDSWNNLESEAKVFIAIAYAVTAIALAIRGGI